MGKIGILKAIKIDKETLYLTGVYEIKIKTYPPRN